MSVNFFQSRFGHSVEPGSNGAFRSLYDAVVQTEVGIYGIVYRLAVWGALLFMIISIITFFMSTRGPSRDQAKAKVMREIFIFMALSCVLSVVSIIAKIAAGV